MKKKKYIKITLSNLYSLANIYNIIFRLSCVILVNHYDIERHFPINEKIYTDDERKQVSEELFNL